MATAVGSVSSRVLEFTVEDFRGQKKNLRILLNGAATDAEVTAIVDAYDGASNGKLTNIRIVNNYPITGQKGSAANALERNISEAMLFTFDATNTNGKPLQKSVSVYAMKAALELTDGSPDQAQTLVTALQTALEAGLAYVGADGAIHTGMTIDWGDSHHYTAGDIVDTV